MITFDNGNFRFRSNGMPNHTLNAEYGVPDDLSPCVPHPTPACTHVEPAGQSPIRCLHGKLSPPLRGS